MCEFGLKRMQSSSNVCNHVALEPGIQNPKLIREHRLVYNTIIIQCVITLYSVYSYSTLEFILMISTYVVIYCD